MNGTSFSIPSGVVDGAGGHVYVRGIDDLIECVSLTSGTLEARADRTGLPIAAGNGLVIGWARAVDRPGVDIVALERSGDMLIDRWSRVLDLPDWVEVDSEEAGRFVVAASLSDDGAVTVRWNAVARYGGGAPPSPDVEDAAGRAANGHLRLHAATGEDEPGKPEATDVPQPRPPKISPPDRLMSYRYRAGRETGPWTHGSADHFLVVRADKPGISMATVDGSDDREVSITSDPGADVLITIDGSLILIYEPGNDAAVWRAINVSSGQAAGTVPATDDITAAVHVDNRLLFEAHRDSDGTDQHVVGAVVLDAGQPVWTHLLGESAPSRPPPLQP